MTKKTDVKVEAAFDISKEISYGKLDIRIICWGLSAGLTRLGKKTTGRDTAHSLIAKDMSDFNKVMDAAFGAFQDSNAGVIRGVEIYSWVNNPSFQVSAKLTTPFSRPKLRCKRIQNSTDPTVFVKEDNACFDSDDNEERTYTCGYNDHIEAFDSSRCETSGTEDAVQKDIRKFNLISNAEFLNSIDDVIRNEMNIQNVHTACITAIMDFHEEYAISPLHNHRQPLENNTITLRELRSYLLYGPDVAVVGTLLNDPSPDVGDFAHVEKAQIIADKIEYFVKPCMDKMLETKYGIEQGNMQVRHWTAVSECNIVPCILPSKWERDTCVPLETKFMMLNELVSNYCPPELKAWYDGTYKRNMNGLEINPTHPDYEGLRLFTGEVKRPDQNRSPMMKKRR
eukprot:CAMPEP_0113312588 /NCGR_PEP_ID=MMETSP0010_2-20120614/9366_1 /TAXON_ID=216773 ORGANISM="Corethron hystrix, Strain 308" /NCGR_SAMPLE_ID=MMETSP0010_2 /ASSEMBLY_ACC=CAM_ASM_000155 /LENGTH=396 /DNA_ID=CAMNT_0000168459 /DNA_START=605 /DNA_END=1795 /DNA_ORIENTATION=- /assembly_acc=CAM_ASM_000155